MLKWARERLRVLTSFRGDHANAIGSVSRDLPPLFIVAAAPQRVTRRVVVISSAGFELSSDQGGLALPKNLPTLAIMSPRRPGVHARWKVQNRLPFQRML